MPKPTSVSAEPLTVHTLCVLDAKETLRPEVAVATKAAGAMPKLWLPGAMKVMVCAAAVTVKLLDTAEAAAKVALPAWLAPTVQLPTLSRVRAELLTMHTTGVLDVRVTAKPDDEVATKAIGVLEKLWLPGAAKLIVCAASAAGASPPPPPPQALKRTRAAQAQAGSVRRGVRRFMAWLSEELLGWVRCQPIGEGQMATVLQRRMTRHEIAFIKYRERRRAWQ